MHGVFSILLIKGPGTRLSIPGGALNPGEDARAGLLDILDDQLCPRDHTRKLKFEIIDKLSEWYRYTIEGAFVQRSPEKDESIVERLVIFVVQLPSKGFMEATNSRVPACVDIEKLNEATSEVLSSVAEHIKKAFACANK